MVRACGRGDGQRSDGHHALWTLGRDMGMQYVIYCMYCGYLHLGSIADTGYLGYLCIAHTAVCAILAQGQYCVLRIRIADTAPPPTQSGTDTPDDTHTEARKQVNPRSLDRPTFHFLSPFAHPPIHCVLPAHIHINWWALSLGCRACRDCQALSSPVGHLSGPCRADTLDSCQACWKQGRL